ncbi:glycosyltransferase family 4 protein [Nonlabens sp. SY33080]|uniref:glycosyltransferase family 4 protein n=1 Tax=Nonlabens sp. SY33080 TaxID=2719911 RepID=UPI001428B0E6|nr:glycosyltransferase family 4 protein [Nonlabens sp. SY33080]
MIKVLTVVDKLNLGGIEKTLLGCLEHFNENGVESHILCSHGGILDDQFVERGAILHNYKKSRWSFMRIYSFYKVILRSEVNVIHLRNGHTSGLYCLIGRLLNKFVIVSIHNESAMFKKTWQRNIFLNKIRNYYLLLQKELIVLFSDRIIGHSKANLGYFSNYKDKIKRKSLIIYNGVDFSMLDASLEKTSIRNKNINLIHVGSFKHQKNHTMLLDIFKNLVKKGYKVSLDLCGDGELQEEIKLKSLGLKVRFHGNVNDLSSLFNKAHILLFPSKHEGFGNVHIEAQYMKVAICCSDIKPHYESVFDKYHRYFFPLNSIDIATQKCEELIARLHEKDADQLLEDAKLFSHKFSNVNMAEKLVNVYYDRK